MSTTKKLQEVIVLAERGLPLTKAVPAVCGFSTLVALAESVGCRRNEMTMLLLGYPHRVYPRLRASLARKLVCTTADVNKLIENYASGRKKTCTATAQKGSGRSPAA